MVRTKEGIHYELLLVFERFKFKPSVVWQKLKTLGYSKSTIYRYYNRWIEADTKVKTLLKELVK